MTCSAIPFYPDGVVSVLVHFVDWCSTVLSPVDVRLQFAMYLPCSSMFSVSSFPIRRFIWHCLYTRLPCSFGVVSSVIASHSTWKRFSVPIAYLCLKSLSSRSRSTSKRSGSLLLLFRKSLILSFVDVNISVFCLGFFCRARRPAPFS